MTLETIMGLLVPGVVILMLLVLGLMLLSGHGAFLIAGYNTMPRQDRQKYDTKALCRFVGGMLLVIDALVAAILVAVLNHITWLIMTGSGLTLAVLAASIIYLNTGNRFKR